MSRSMIRRALTALAVTGIVAPVLAVVTMAPASAATGVDVANLASANLGLHYCDTNSRGGSGYFTSCKGENWCADFAKWVWQNVGLPVDGLTPESGSFYTYGSRNGTLHTDSGYVPQAGDAVVFNYHGGGDADHVGLVTRVGGDGVIQVINGNFGSDPRTSKVGYSSGSGRVGATIEGQTVSAFVTPAGVQHSALARVGVVKNGQLLVKEGGLGTDWAAEADGVAGFSLSGNRIGILRTDGTASVKEGPLDANWVPELDNVKQIVLSGNRIGVVKADGSAWVKEGAPDANWMQEDSNVTALDLSGNRIGVLHTDGTMTVKEGALDANWVPELDGVRQFALSGNRIGAVKTDGTAWVKEGAPDANWTAENDNVTALDLSGNRVGVLRTDGTLSVKEGALDTNWTPELDGVRQFSLSGNRIGVIQTNGAARVKEGALDANWVDENDSTTTIDLA